MAAYEAQVLPVIAFQPVFFLVVEQVLLQVLQKHAPAEQVLHTEPVAAAVELAVAAAAA